MKKSKSLILLCLSALALSSCGLFSSSEDSSSSSSEKKNEGYALYGDFTDSNWDNSPATDSKYYIGQNTAYYSVDVTFLDIEDAKFRVVEYGSLTLALGYNELNENSSGVLGTDSSSNILVNPGETYKLTITLGETKSILVTQISGDIGGDESSTGTSYDGAYQLYGSFNGDVWTEGVPNDTNYVLPYNSVDSSSRYWKRTVTMASKEEYEWSPAFRITEYGTYTTIAGYNELSVTSNSSITVSAGDDDNLNLDDTYAGVKLDLTIDLRDSSYTINIDTHDDSFEPCNGYIDESEKSEDTGGSSPIYQYTLYGSFTGDNLWNESPTDSSYILKYDPQESSSKYWKRIVTMASAEEYIYNPAFRIIEYGDYDTLIAGYSTVSVTSNTSISVTADGDNIGLNKDLYASATLDLTIDLRGSYTINIDTHDESFTECDGYQKTGEEDTGDTNPSYEAPTDVNKDTYFVLYGGFSDSSWNASPTKQENTGYALGFDSRYQESRYWKRTVTTDNGGYGFRIIEYGNYNSLVAGYSNFEIDSASTPYVEAGDLNDNNIKLASTNTSYDLTIDMRTGNFKLYVSPHSSSFTECDGYYEEDPTAFLNNYSSLGVGDDYIMGADISSIKEVEDAGGAFYDYQGNKVDCIQYLASQGINYARLRLWVDPTDGSGNSYLGGGNDLNTDIEIAKRCTDAGMKICLDLHYSDFWTHHGQQYAPKSWTSYSGSTLYSAAASWTTNVLTSLASAGVNVSMVQVGNETNNNSICGTSGTDFFKQCCQAVRSYSQNIDIVIHYALDQEVGTYTSYYNALINANVDFDVLGLSYYPYFHLKNGSLDSVLSSLTSSFPTKKLCLMEYSTGWTLTYPWDNQGTYGETNNTFGTEQVSAGGYGGSVQEQTRCIYDINKSMASLGSQGLGTFYWEPAWLARSGTAWASSNAAGYYTSNNSSLTGADVTTWSNQALFDYRGYALDSLKIYNIMK